MKLNDHQLIVSFLQPIRSLAELTCDVKDGKFDVCKEQLIACLNDEIKEENVRFKLYQDEALQKKLIAFYTACIDLLK
jgi:hypothetical protein